MTTAGKIELAEFLLKEGLIKMLRGVFVKLQ